MFVNTIFQKLFSLLVQYLTKQTSEDNPQDYVQLYDRLAPTLRQLLSFDPEAGSATVLKLLRERISQFQEILENRKQRGRFLGLDTVKEMFSVLCVFLFSFDLFGLVLLCT
jgi:hypothetical protein